MAERRTLVEGVTPAIDRAVEEHFIYANKPKPEAGTPPPATVQASEKRDRKGPAISRAPLTTRIRSDFATALKRASLERQLQGIEPNSMVDMLEEALEPWLRNNGYLS